MKTIEFDIAERLWNSNSEISKKHKAILFYELACEKNDPNALLKMYEIREENSTYFHFLFKKSDIEYLKLAMQHGSAIAYEIAAYKYSDDSFYKKLIYLLMAIKLKKADAKENNEKLIDIFIEESEGVYYRYLEHAFSEVESWQIGDELNTSPPLIELLHPHSVMNDYFIQKYLDIDYIEIEKYAPKIKFNRIKFKQMIDSSDIIINNFANDNVPDSNANDNDSNSKVILEYKKSPNSLFYKRALYQSALNGDAAAAMFIFENKIGSSYEKMYRQSLLNGHKKNLYSILDKFINENLNCSDFFEFDFSGKEKHENHVLFLLYFCGLLEKIDVSYRDLEKLSIKCCCLDEYFDSCFYISHINIIEFKYKRCSFFALDMVDSFLSTWSPGEEFHQLFLNAAKNLGVKDFE